VLPNLPRSAAYVPALEEWRYVQNYAGAKSAVIGEITVRALGS
jgi:hypothetical protein